MDKRELRFVVSGQNMAKDSNCDFTNIVAGSKGYLVASFNFSKEWKSVDNKIAVFSVFDEKFSSVLNKSNKCVIPEKSLVWSNFDVSVIGKTKDGKLICTNKVTVVQKVVR